MIGSEFSGCLVEEKLGEGGMGAVFLATRRRDGRRVAVKFLPPEQASDESWRTRFVRTGEMLQEISHPNLAKIYSVEGTGDRPHIVMELVKGQPLDELLHERGRVSQAQGLRIARDIARGLAEAHRAGLIHRDIKPANVLLTHTGKSKVIDFGLGKSTRPDQVLTMPGQILGTPYYMAPEQWGAHSVDGRCDIFSLGSTLYHLVTGQLPFRAEGHMEVAALIKAGEFRRPREIDAELSEDVELLVLRMMEPDRDLRYPAMELVADDLQRVLDGRHVNVPRLVEVSKAGKKVRYPLLPGTSFRLGRLSTCRFVLAGQEVSREHAEIVRDRRGYRLRDLGSSKGSFVQDARIKEVSLKDNDRIRIGTRSFVFRSGLPNLASSSVDEAPCERQEVRSVPEPILQALINEADRRTILTLIEQLSPATHQVRLKATRHLLEFVDGAEIARTAEKRLGEVLGQLQRRAASRLFFLTHERLGEDAGKWLAWWDQHWTTYPEQVGPCPPPLLPRPRLRVKGEASAVHDLGAGLEFRIGRSSQCEVRLPHGSVSRLHASIFRLHERLAIRDESSRLGTMLNGERVHVAFLSPGDKLVLGKIRLRYEEAREESVRPPSQAGAFLIDPVAFAVLADLVHPSTARALVAFLIAEERLEWVDEEVGAFHSHDPALCERLARAVRRNYQDEAQRARELLPRVLGATAKSTAGWLALLQKRKRKLPAQVLPLGWGLPL